MQSEGPPLEQLLHRLTNCPNEFWELPADKPKAIEAANTVTIAIVCDHFRSMQPELHGEIISSELQIKSAAHGLLVRLATWVFHDPWFVSRPELAPRMQNAICSPLLRQLAEMVRPTTFVSDADRREELIRVCLNLIGLRPRGESIEQSTDRLTTLDTIERERILKATLAAEKRAREVREAMAKAKAMESASRYGE